MSSLRHVLLFLKEEIMRTFRNLSYALLFLAIICLGCLVAFSQAQESMLAFTLLGVFVAMFAMSVVAFLASLLMYFNSKNSNVTVLKRRAARARRAS
jgi:predicted permease